MSVIVDTFVRALAAGSYRLLHAGEWASKLNFVVSGLLSDCKAETARQIMRWTLPLTDTPLEVVPYLLYQFGLPAYEESYAATMDRLRDAWPTHEVAGAKDMLDSQAVLCGLADASAEPDEPADFNFCIVTTDAGAVPTYGTFTWGDGTIYGEAVDPLVARNVIRMMRYFRPAGARWKGFCVPT